MHLSADYPKLGSEKTSKVPTAKKPKPRAPRGWRDKVFFPGRALPTYTGPYPVGTMEIEVPAAHPKAFSHITRHNRHVLQLETVLMTIYYPASLDKHNTTIPPDSKPRMSRELWLGRPRMSIATGYGNFAGVGRLAVPLFLPTMFTKLPAFRNAPLAHYWAPEVNTKSEKGTEVKLETGEPPEGASDEPVFPLILFSHGLGGTRTMYSSVCGEFASYGFIVCAVEHRDGSGPRTYINHAKHGEGTATNLERRGHIDHYQHEHRQGFDVIDYIFPKDNPMDTSPANDKGVDSELRKAQVDLRMAELEEAYSVMRELVEGNGQMIADRNLRKEGYKGSSRFGLEGIDWCRWKGRCHLDKVTICGHSFGAATAVEILRHDDRFNYISQGIIYDIWGAGTRPADGEPNHRINAPLIAINSEAFTYWPSNFELVESLVQEAQTGPDPKPAWLMTLRGTVHVSQSDFSLLYPNICSLFLKMVANPRRALDLNINASLEFLGHVLPADQAQVSRAYKNEKLLEAELNPLDRIPTTEMHRPKDKYIAMRLQIQHEWIYRISPQFFRKAKRWSAERKGRPVENSDEVWLHMKPSEETIEQHLRRTPGRNPGTQEDINNRAPVTSDHTAEGAPIRLSDSPGGEAAFGHGDKDADQDEKN